MKVTYYAFLALEKLIEKVPIGFAKSVARALSVCYYYAFPRKRNLVKKNMRRVLGPDAREREVARTARRAARYYADYWIDFFWVSTLKKEDVLRRLTIVDAEELVETVKGGSGALIVLPHYGSWEAGAFYLTSIGPFAAVAEVLRPKELFELFVRLREKVGIKIFPYDHKEETREKMVEALKGGQMLALLCDRDLKGTGVEVEFFGEKTTLPPGPASLALKSGVPIFCVNVRNTEDGWVGRATEPIFARQDAPREEEIKRIMQEIARRLEELIRDDPAQWHMFMPSWPSDRK